MNQENRNPFTWDEQMRVYIPPLHNDATEKRRMLWIYDSQPLYSFYLRKAFVYTKKNRLPLWYRLRYRTAANVSFKQKLEEFFFLFKNSFTSLIDFVVVGFIFSLIQSNEKFTLSSAALNVMVLLLERISDATCNFCGLTHSFSIVDHHKATMSNIGSFEARLVIV